MRFTLMAGAMALLAGCGPASDQPGPVVATNSTEGICADGAARLEGTGLCQSEAAALLTRNPEIRSPELPDCSNWAVNETMLPAGEALLYFASACGGIVTKLGFAGGAKSAEIAYERSAAYGEAVAGRIMIRLFGTEPDPMGALKGAIAALPVEEQAICEIREAGYEGWPPDALLIAPTEAARAEMPQDQPIAACGPFGMDESKVSYWRVRQGFAWFFDLGTQDPDFDAGNMTVVVKGADGVWAVKP